MWDSVTFKSLACVLAIGPVIIMGPQVQIMDPQVQIMGSQIILLNEHRESLQPGRWNKSMQSAHIENFDCSIYV